MLRNKRPLVAKNFKFICNADDVAYYINGSLVQLKFISCNIYSSTKLLNTYVKQQAMG